MKVEKIKDLSFGILFFLWLGTAALRNYEIISRTVTGIIYGILLIASILHMIIFRKESINKNK